ncbi:MAG: penicillin-binding protein 2 [Deltaproteobacteria bacterium]|nr:penicillin-binding protein 2 [Deltaproteobacteria bacterium]MBT4527447.1 penicillin-binding protein 2 [Deltaproteobacteria bacterium]
MKEEPLNTEELQLFRRRDFIIRCVIGSPFILILWRLWNLQIRKGDIFSDLSKGNRIRLKSVPAPRGIIYDRKSIVLSKNIPSFNLNLIQEDTPDIAAVLNKISYALKIPLKKLESALKNRKKVAEFEPIRIYKDLTSRQIAIVSAYQEEFPGVTMEVSPRRYYPLLKTGAHIYGYMNDITKVQLKKLPLEKLMSAKVIGQDGIEAIYNDILIGTDGGEQVEVDSTGRVIKTLKSIEPIPGNDIQLSIDNRLQEKVEQMMKGKKGAIIVMNPNDGEILSIVSFPSFDPNEFSQGMTTERWNQLSNDPAKALNNKCIKDYYAPGSTFKMVVAIAALEMGLITPETEIQCDGFFKFNRDRFHCWKRSGHGLLTVTEALKQSCNVFFYKLIVEIGVDKVKEYANLLGLGKLTGIDLLNEKSGVIPSKEWKLKRYKKKWFPGETIPVAIGQGYVSVTPLQLLNYVNVIANDGYRVRPHLVNKILTDYPNITKRQTQTLIRQINNKVQKKISLKPETLDVIKRGMALNVQSRKGTGIRAKSKKIPIAGKTGTAQVISLATRDRLKKEHGEVKEKYYDHSWFVGFAPVDKPKISMVVFIEHGQSGSNSAALFKEIAEYYFSKIAPISEEEIGSFVTEDILNEV